MIFIIVLCFEDGIPILEHWDIIKWILYKLLLLCINNLEGAHQCICHMTTMMQTEKILMCNIFLKSAAN